MLKDVGAGFLKIPGERKTVFFSAVKNGRNFGGSDDSNKVFPRGKYCKICTFLRKNINFDVFQEYRNFVIFQKTIFVN